MPEPTDRKPPLEKVPRRPQSDRPATLPHDLPMFPENAPLDDKGEPVVRP